MTNSAGLYPLWAAAIREFPEKIGLAVKIYRAFWDVCVQWRYRKMARVYQNARKIGLFAL